MGHGQSLLAAGAVLAASVCLSAGPPAPQTPSPPTFRASVDVVSVTAVVRNRKGRFVGDLRREDFEVFDQGQRRRVLEFQTDRSMATSIALLFDVSGSMRLAPRIPAARDAVGHILSWAQPGVDEVSLFNFHTSLREVQGFTTDAHKIRRALERTEPFGATSLYDAIAAVAERLTGRTPKRRAVVVLTDGIDTSSRLTPADVSAIASAIDVPVYVFVVGAASDDPKITGAGHSTEEARPHGGLADLARWTGGTLFFAGRPAEASAAARQLLSDLRHQYMLAFESWGGPGWRSLSIRTRDRDLVVRSRSGYFAGPSRPVG